jgi:hypothetical protein
MANGPRGSALERLRPGFSSGQALSAMERVSATTLPAGYSYEWTATALQEKATAGKTGIVLGLAVMFARLPIGRSRSNSVAKRFDETEHRAQRARTGENIAPSRSIRVLAV